MSRGYPRGRTTATRLRNKAQGWRAAPTLGNRPEARQPPRGYGCPACPGFGAATDLRRQLQPHAAPNATPPGSQDPSIVVASRFIWKNHGPSREGGSILLCASVAWLFLRDSGRDKRVVGDTVESNILNALDL